MKPKSNYRGDKDKPAVQDTCQTPPYALDPLIPYLNKEWIIWEPAVGKGFLQETIQKIGFNVFGTDIIYGDNFFSFEPDNKWDCIITNPPYGIKYKWLLRCYELGKPFALLVPIETLGAQSAQKLFERYGFEIMLLDSRVDFFMPYSGLDGKGAQFPVMWLCWNILPEKVMLGKIKEAKRKFIENYKHNQENTPDEQRFEVLQEWQATT